MASVALEGVSKVFPGGVKAVDQIDLEVRDKEFLVLVGPSGCGKTTTLRMIAGLDGVTQGTIRIAGRAVNQVAPKDRNLAMVFQNYALYPHLSVYKNMAFGLQLRYGRNWISRIWKWLTCPSEAAQWAARRRGIRQQVRQAAEMLGIEQLLDRMPRQLSGGERQRVALGRAIVRKPAAFLLDEPLSNLDARLRIEMRRELKRLHQQLQATMIYVTHDQVEALTLGQRIVVLNLGRVQQIGTPREVYQQPRNQFVASFIGTPPMNFVTGCLQRSQATIRFDGQGVAVSWDAARLHPSVYDRLNDRMNRQILLGVRPEDIDIQRPPADSQTPGGNRGTITDIERLGDADVVQVQTSRPGGEGLHDQRSLYVKTPAGTARQPGDQVHLTFDASRTHLFDWESGSSLTYTESE